MIEASPEKAGVGGSTPSLATISQRLSLRVKKAFSLLSNSLQRNNAV